MIDEGVCSAVVANIAHAHVIMSELHEAAFGGNQEVLEECIHKGINPSQPDPGWGMKTPLHIASAQGHKSCVYYLLNSGARVNAVTDSGWTPGHSACETGQVYIK